MPKRSRLSKGVSSKPKARLVHWLEGRRIVRVRLMTKQELKSEGWDENAVATVLVLDDGTKVYPSSDEEGNDVGNLFADIRGKKAYVFSRDMLGGS